MFDVLHVLSRDFQPVSRLGPSTKKGYAVYIRTMSWSANGQPLIPLGKEMYENEHDKYWAHGWGCSISELALALDPV